MRLVRYEQTKQALGSEVTIGFVSDKATDVCDELMKTIWKNIYIFERSFSRFIPASELSLFNRSAGIKTPISPAFRDLLLAAQSMAIKTQGLYNPFILPALQRAGYKRSAAVGYEHDPVDDYSHRTVVPIDALVIGDDWATIPYDSALDMGGCGKGYLADVCARLLQDVSITHYYLAFGGDIATSGTDEHGNNWLMNIQDAHNLAAVSDWVIKCPSTPFAIATSGTFRRQAHAHAKPWHHIIDPTTLKSAETDIRLATICASSALIADVLASCVVIVGSSKASDFLSQYPVDSYLLQCQNSDRAFEIQSGIAIYNESKHQKVSV